MNFDHQWQKLGFARVSLREIQEKQSARLAIMETSPFNSPQALAARQEFHQDEPKELEYARRVRALQQKLGVGPWLDAAKVGAALKVSTEGLELERQAMARVKGLSAEEHLKARDAGTGRIKSDGGKDIYIPKWFVRSRPTRRGKRLAK